jgi:hypothetical protein
MSAAEIDTLMQHVAASAIAPKTAIALMVLNGESREESARRVFYALGGGDTIHLDAAGRPVYVASGKLVADVEQAIAVDLGLDAS